MIFIFQIIAVFSLIWSQRQDFNLRPAAYKTAALSTELHWRICTGCILRAFPIKLYFTLVKHLDSNQKLGFIRAKDTAENTLGGYLWLLEHRKRIELSSSAWKADILTVVRPMQITGSRADRLQFYSNELLYAPYVLAERVGFEPTGHF